MTIMLRFGDDPRRVVLGAALALTFTLGSAVTASSPAHQLNAGASATQLADRLTPPTTVPGGSTTPGGSPSETPAPSGAPAPSGDFGPWKQVFLDDFTTDVPLGQFPAAVASKWSAYRWPSTDTSRNGKYAPERVVSIGNGVLRKSLRTEDGQPLVAALVPKLAGVGTAGMLYGRYEVRARFDRLPGYKVAWLLWPSAGNSFWPAHGEIDWPETNLDQQHVMGFVHHWGATSGSDQSWARVNTNLQQWHTYTIEWSPGTNQRGLVVLYLDGIEVLRVTERVPQAALRWVIQTETQLGGGKPAPQTRGDVEIDWVSAWAYAP